MERLLHLRPAQIDPANTDGQIKVSPHEFFRRADDNVYRAKQSGRNCVVG